MGTAAVGVDVVLDDLSIELAKAVWLDENRDPPTHPKQREINSHDHESQYPRDKSHGGAQNRTNDSGPDREAEGNESDQSAHGMKDHSRREVIGSTSRGATETGTINGGHDGGRLIADDFGKAKVLVSLDGRDIEDAVTERAKGHRGIS